MARNPTPAETSHTDGNQIASLIVVQGTLGTADIGGTANTMPVGGDPITGAMYVKDLSGATGTTNIQGSITITGSDGIVNTTLLSDQLVPTDVGLVTNTIIHGSSTTGGGTFIDVKVNPSGALQVGGNINIDTGTVLISNIGGGGTVNVESGRLAVNLMAGEAAIQGGSGVVSTNTTRVTLATNVPLPALNNGSINILTGTLQSSGTSTGVGVVSNLTNGSVNILTGTTTLVSTVTTVSNLTNGSANILTGTFNLGTVVNNGGTIQNLNFGTIAIDPVPTRTQSTWGTLGTTGATVFGTMAGGTSSGAGTEIFVTGLSITIPATGGSQDISIGFGTNSGTFHSGTGLLARGMFVAGGGMVRTFSPAVNSGTNAQVTYFQAGAGTAAVELSYFTAASTL